MVQYAESQISTVKPGTSEPEQIAPGKNLHLHTRYGSWPQEPDVSQVPQIGVPIRACEMDTEYPDSDGHPVIAIQSVSSPCMSRNGDTLHYSIAPNGGVKMFEYVNFDILKTTTNVGVVAAQSAPPRKEKPSSNADNPNLAETLQWLSGASEVESATGAPPFSHYTFESQGENVCSVAITETRVQAGPNWWDRLSFSLTDIDPMDIRVDKLEAPSFAGESAVSFHTTNYREKITDSSSGHSQDIPTRDHKLITNDWFALRFAKAFKHAVELCGGKQSSF
jgi:hypothetical protein